MSESFGRRGAMLLAVAALLIAGCDASSTPADRTTDSAKKPAGREDVTFYVAGMNRRLKIL